jgi:ketosteroid isomerase-like protein
MAKPEAASNVDIVRAFLEAYDDDRLDDALALLDHKVVSEPLNRPGRSVYFGREGMRQLHADLRSSADGGHAQFEEYVELPDGRVQVYGWQILANGHVGPKVLPTITVRDGLIVHLQGWAADEERA